MYLSVEIDHVNGIKSKTKFETLEDALDDLMYLLGANVGDKKEKIKTIEKDNLLFIQSYDDDIYQMFKNYTADKPRTIEQLREYLKNGGHVTIDWGDRAPVEYYLKVANKK